MLEKISLFKSKNDFLLLFLILTITLFYSMLIEYQNYKKLTQFDSSIKNVIVLKQYTKTKIRKNKKPRTYQVLKLKSDEGFVFYTTQNIKLPMVQSSMLKLEIWISKISFYDFLTSFYARSTVLEINSNSNKVKLNTYLNSIHKDKDIADTYKALYTATTGSKNLQEIFSFLGVSHLVAISGFHLGVLSTVLFFLIKYPYKLLQNNFFPFRNYNFDSFIFISLFLLTYLLFLDSPASLVRALFMFVIGFFLYNRGIKILSMQTLFLTMIILLAFIPRLIFSIGFWLSLSGVFYIFLFLIFFNQLSKIKQAVIIPIWVYLLMLPISLFIFENFSLYHPFSILWTLIFSIFYPLSIVLHLIGFGHILDNLILSLINISFEKIQITISWVNIVSYISISLISIKSRYFLYGLIVYSLGIFIFSLLKASHFI